MSFVSGFDIVWLLETKTNIRFSVPGYYVYHNPSKLCSKRGGVVMLIKCVLSDYIRRVDLSIEGQIWVELYCYPDTVFGGVYIPPADSPYYDVLSFSAMDAAISCFSRAIVLGDMNSRVAVPSFYSDIGVPYVYRNTVDFIQNAHGKKLLEFCNGSKMIIANHLVYGGKCFGGGLSFKRRTQWISEIDLCLIKDELLRNLEEVVVNHDISGSDHAPLAVKLNLARMHLRSPFLLNERAGNLGRSWIAAQTSHYVERGPSCKKVDIGRFKTDIDEIVPPDLSSISLESVSAVLESGCSVINSVAKSAPSNMSENEWDQRHPRWKRLLDRDDARTIWRSINWRGGIDEDKYSEQPEDTQFKVHFEELLNRPTQAIDININSEDLPQIPLLDAPFTLQELHDVVKDIKRDKSYIGICPGLFAVLPTSWLLFFLTVFNFVFLCMCYPFSWCHNRLITLFKSGNRMDCGNFRGISIMNTLAKVYDMLIMKRLYLWHNIDMCQAGSQKSRGCIEQIMSLRLLIDYASFKKEKLYVLFVDFSKAYDRVPRYKLMECLKNRGCGKIMLMAICAMYRCTKNVLRAASIDSNMGVRQGAPTSCLLFVIYIDKMIRMIKERVGPDGFLGELHALLLMDDTVILATSREMCLTKMNVLSQYCHEYGMQINEKKTKFFVINGSLRDKEMLSTGQLRVEYCYKYLYLGAWFTDDACMKSSLKQHAINIISTVNKFVIFCAHNSLMPFVYKLKVFRAAMMSSLLYTVARKVG